MFEYVCVYLCAFICVCKLMCLCIYAYIYIYTHMCMYVYMSILLAQSNGPIVLAESNSLINCTDDHRRRYCFQWSRTATEIPFLAPR